MMHNSLLRSSIQYAAAALVAVVTIASFVQWYSFENGIVGHPIDMSVLPTISSDFQRELLEDGYVSRSEYRAANEGYAGCLRAAGIEARGPIDILRKDFVVVNYDISESDAGAWADQADCENSYTSIVNGVYFTQAIPVGDEIAAKKELVIQCLSEAGSPNDDSSTPLSEIAEPYFEGKMTYDEAMCIHLHLPLFYVENLHEH